MEMQQHILFHIVEQSYYCQQYKGTKGFMQKCPIFLFDFNQIWILTDFNKSLQFHENMASGSWADTCSRTDMAKLKRHFS